MKILGIETSAKAASAAVMEEGVLLGEFFTNVKLTHSQTILPMVHALLDCTKTPLGEIDVFAVSQGPGSFTGLRIGIAAVKGMAFGTEKPCAGVSTLEAMAYGCAGGNRIVCPVMDARCNQVYTALFASTPQGLTRLRPDEAMTLDALEKILAQLSREILLVGDGAEMCYNKFANQIGSVRLAPEHQRMQRAGGVCLAAQYLCKDSLVSADALQPAYLRLPQAQRELLARQQKENLIPPGGKG